MTQHEPGIIHTWTFDQTERWVDVKGIEHRIPWIERNYALNILLFLLRGADYYKRVYARQHGLDPDADRDNPFIWMESKPIIRALRKRILASEGTAFSVKR